MTLGRVLTADIPDSAKEQILRTNFLRLVEKQ
jgi:hypothetical protein